VPCACSTLAYPFKTKDKSKKIKVNKIAFSNYQIRHFQIFKLPNFQIISTLAYPFKTKDKSAALSLPKCKKIKVNKIAFSNFQISTLSDQHINTLAH